MNNNHEALNAVETTDTLTLDDLTLTDVEIDELQSEDALGIPELGATYSIYSCTSMCSL